MNVPGSEMTGQRGGIHKLGDPRAALKPTHMIGGYAQKALYGFNYYGHGRLQPRRIRCRAQDVEGRLALRHADRRSTRTAPRRAQNGSPLQPSPRANRDGAQGPGQVHRLPYLFVYLENGDSRAAKVWNTLVPDVRVEAGHRLSEGLGKSETLERRLAPQEAAVRSSRASVRNGAFWRPLLLSGSAPDRRLLRAVHV